jgi:hypothetical protein
MVEKRYPVVPPQNFIADGTANGVVTVNDTTLFKVKQDVTLTANTLPIKVLEVKQVLSATQMVVGPDPGAIDLTTDVSMYTVALAATIGCPSSQKRPPINFDEYDRATYEEEPVVARRSVLVDDLGNKFSISNPFPVGTAPIWDEIDLTYDANQNLETVTYHAGTQSFTDTLTYDSNQNLVKVVKS